MKGLNPQPLLHVDSLNKSFPTGKQGIFRRQMMQVLRDVKLHVNQGEVLGLVGESGSGKSTIGKAVLRLLDIDSGSVTFDGHDIHKIDRETLRGLRKDMQIIFQDPYASLDPRKTIHAVLSEALNTHQLHTGDARQPRLLELMNMVGLDPSFLSRKPHEFSGGQRQRIGIARALAVEPKFIVADEAVSALDVSIQAQILNLLADLRAKTGISILFISHDLSVVRFISDRVMVLYLGRVMEVGPADEIHFAPKHPYTAALVSAEPSLGAPRERIQLTGEIASPLNPPTGCVFRTRCPFALDECATIVPELREMPGRRQKACIRDDVL